MSTGYQRADLVRAAEAGIRAPSLHNSQPWLFRLRDGGIELLLDESRRLPSADRTGWAARIACGAAVFNARLALAGTGVPAQVQIRPEPSVTACLTPGPPRPPTYAEQELIAAIPRRHSNRQPFSAHPVPADIRARLIEEAREEGAWLALLVGMTALTGFSELAKGADRVLRRDFAYQAELSAWSHVDTAGDGVPVTAGGPVPAPQDLLPQRAFADRPRAPGRDYEPEPLVAVLGVRGDSPVDQLVAGQALQRVLLAATAAGLAASLISQPIEVPAARDQLRRSLGRAGTPQMTLRLGYGPAGRPTPRRSLDDVLVS